MKLKSNSNQLAIRRLEDVDSGYADADELVANLRRTAAALATEESDIVQRLANRAVGVEVTTRVAKLLGDDGPENPEAPNGLQRRLAEIAIDRADYRRAIEEAERRKVTARYAASKIICDEVKATYADAVKSVADAFIAAHEAHNGLLAIINALNERDVAWTAHMVPMQADRILGGRLAGWLKEASAAGYVEPESIPKEMRV